MEVESLTTGEDSPQVNVEEQTIDNAEVVEEEKKK